jgi:hypothetical protein
MTDYLTRRAALAVLAGGAASAADTNAVTTRFGETQDNFANPHRGLMTQHSRLPFSVAYLRVNWADLEPEEAKYNWAVFDGPIEALKPKAVRVSFRVMTANAHSKGYYCSPKWLFDAGCKSFDYVAGGDPTSGGERIPRIEPDYADPIYLEKHGKFLQALARRYDGHPQMEFADIGSYGIWGEWHTTHPAPFEVRRQIIDLYVNNFRKLPLVFMSDDTEGLNYALSKGTGFRRDGVGSPWHAQNWIGSKRYQNVRGFDTAWRRAPAVFEWFGDRKYMESRKWSFADSLNFMLDNHVTYINDNIGRVPDEELPLLQDLERRAGYRFVLREVTQAVRGPDVVVTMQWSNVGVAPIYREYRLQLSLVGADQSVAATLPAADAREWLPGDHTVVARLQARPGTYTLMAALVGAGGGPEIRLACHAPEEGLRYRIGTVRIAAS